MTVQNNEYVICVGAQKAGTTLLYDHLKNHPDINRTKNKELHYFDYGIDHSESEYRRYFEGNNRINLDITPAYMFYATAIESIAKVLPKERVKLLVILRDPIERALSHYKMNIQLGIEENTIERAFEIEADGLFGCNSEYEMRKYSYLARGRYYHQVKNILMHFEPSQVYILEFKDFVLNQQSEINKVCGFLNISEIDVENKVSGRGVNIRSTYIHRLARKARNHIPLNSDHVLYNSLVKFYHKVNTRTRDDLDNEFRKKMKEYFSDDNQKLSELIGLDLKNRWL